MLDGKLPRFRSRLLTWYRKNARDLPWRRTKDPYKIWVSEIMLQQTQVVTVIPYYERWMRRFPNLKSLAEAPLSEVLKYWAGLGYYRRARMLHDAAKQLRNPPHPSLSLRERVRVRDVRIPNSSTELQKLPGIGRYTAGAIASIAFGEAVPVLDGNVKRVLARITALKEAVDTSAGEKKLWDTAEKIVTPNGARPLFRRKRGLAPSAFHPGDINQSLMELGAAICLPDNPRCGICPVQTLCKANHLGRAADFPIIKKREQIKKIRTAALILRNNGKVLIQRQPENGRWGGLWMFPHWPNKKAMMRDMKMNVGARSPRPGRGNPAPTLKHRLTINHAFTKYRVRLEVFEVKAKGDSHFFRRHFDERSEEKSGISRLRLEMTNKNVTWVPLSELHSLPLPSPHRKIAEEILKNG